MQTKEAFLGSLKGTAQEYGSLSTVGDLCAYQISADKARREGPVQRWKCSSLLKALVLGLYGCFSFILFETIVWSTDSIYLFIIFKNSLMFLYF